MYFVLNDNTSLKEIEETFSNFYPYLQIAFFKKAHKKYEASPEAEKADPATRITELAPNHISGILEILPLQKVADVEKEFPERFGLSVQIYRKEKDHWEQTTGMDDFTLKDLNEFGRNSSDEYIIANDDEENPEEEEEEPAS